jgi:adenylyltransferase/sulfurtransferase
VERWNVSRTREFTAQELTRYRRHLSLQGIGEEGQRRLLRGSALVIGVGGLGSPISLYLAAAGVGRIGLVDDDVVDLANLQRQVLYQTGDIGKRKVHRAKVRLSALNPEIDITTYDTRFDEDTAASLAADYEILVDGSDTLETRYLINDTAIACGIPYVYGAVLGHEGQVSSFAPAHNGPCYRCLFPELPPREAIPRPEVVGILGVLPGVIGCLEATEVIKWLTGTGTPLVGRLLLYDALCLRFDEVGIGRQAGCASCGGEAASR